VPRAEDLVDVANIAESLDSTLLQKIGSSVHEDYSEDENSRDGWKESYEQAMKIAMQVREQKSSPWQGASNVKYPLLTIACLQFHARAYPALIPGSNIVQGKVIGRDELGVKKVLAERIGMHMSYQVLDEMQEWEENMDRMLITLPITGCEFKKTYYDSEVGTNVSEHVFAKDLVINYYAKSVEKALRKTHILSLSKNELYEKQKAGIFLDIDLGDPIPRDDRLTKTTDEMQGMRPPGTGSDKPYTILEYHGFWDLDEDGYKEPYIITIEEASRKVLRIVARYNEGSISRSATGEMLRIEPKEYFTQYDFIKNPSGGIYGIGFGLLLGPLNETVNTLINQLVDSGTLSNLQAGFISKSLRIQKGSMKFTPGEWKTLNVMGQDIAQGIFPLPTREPSNVLFSLLGYLVESGERLASTTDMMVGENPGQNQKATTTMAVMESGMKVFTAIYKRIRKSLGKEFRKLFILNGEYLDPEVYFSIIDPTTRELQTLDVQQTDYTAGLVDVIPSADPNIATQMQRLAKAQLLIELRPTGALNPTNPFEYEQSRRLLEALEIPDIDRILPPPPEQLPPSPDMLKIQLEMEKEANEEREREFRRELDFAELEYKAQKDGIALDIQKHSADTQRMKATKEASKKKTSE